MSTRINCVVIAYQWAALGPDPAELPVMLGISDSISRAQAAAAQAVESGQAWLAHVTEVRRMMGADLGSHYVPCGRWWHGRLDRHGHIRWFSGYSGSIAPADRAGSVK